MPYIRVTSNVPKSSVQLQPTLAAISKALAGALAKPEQVVMVHLALDTPMLFQASDDVRAPVLLLSVVGLSR
jgi:hypothetical protein